MLVLLNLDSKKFSNYFQNFSDSGGLYDLILNILNKLLNVQTVHSFQSAITHRLTI